MFSRTLSLANHLQLKLGTIEAYIRVKPSVQGRSQKESLLYGFESTAIVDCAGPT